MSRGVIVWHVITSWPLSAWHHLLSLNKSLELYKLDSCKNMYLCCYDYDFVCCSKYWSRTDDDLKKIEVPKHITSIIQESNVDVALRLGSSSKNWFKSQLKYLNPFPEPQLTFLWPHKPDHWFKPLIGRWGSRDLNIGLWLVGPPVTQIIRPWFASPGVSSWSPGRIFMFMILLILGETLWQAVGTGLWQGISGARQMMPQIVYLFTSPIPLLYSEHLN